MGSRILDTQAKPPRVLVMDSFRLNEDMSDVRELPLPLPKGLEAPDEPLDVPIGEKEKGAGVDEVSFDIKYEGRPGDEPVDVAMEEKADDDVPPDRTAKAIAQQRSVFHCSVGPPRPPGSLRASLARTRRLTPPHRPAPTHPLTRTQVQRAARNRRH